MVIKLVPQRFPKALPVLGAVVLLIFFLTATRLRHGSFLPSSASTENGKSGSAQSKNRPMQRPKLAPGTCLPEIEFLRRVELGLSDKIAYSRRCVKPILDPKYDRDTVANITHPLITHRTTVDLNSCSHADFIPCDHLPLSVPAPYPHKTYDHITFGVASSFERLSDSLPAFAHWLAGTGALLVAVVSDADSPDPKFNLTALEVKYRAQGVTASFIPPILKKENSGDPDITVERHHFMLIRNLLDVATEKTKWLGILDDDTFFPSMYPLDQELRKHDHKKSLWLGALSDSFSSVKNWGYMAYGGAGVFLSKPLAQEMNPHLKECMDEATVDTGDGFLRDCIYTRTHAKLTQVPGLHQHDTRGDMSGFFESGVRPLSVHHWRSWYEAPMPAMASVTGICGDCFLGRHRFAEDTLLANGYSITQYPEGLHKIDLDRMEGTWRNPGRDFDFSYGPLRDRLSPEQKKSYRLLDAEVTKSGAFRQIYVYKGNEEEGESDEVVELLWEKE